jgi:hypothetical protein
VVIDSTIAFRLSVRLAPKTTFAPRADKCLAIASPIPLLAPVIATIFPLIPSIVLNFNYLNDGTKVGRFIKPDVAQSSIDVVKSWIR